MATKSHACILLVDDEPDLLHLMELTLIKMGLDTERASNVAEARDRLVARHYDLCLTDMRLPDGSGLEVVAIANQQKNSRAGGGDHRVW